MGIKVMEMWVLLLKGFYKMEEIYFCFMNMKINYLVVKYMFDLRRMKNKEIYEMNLLIIGLFIYLIYNKYIFMKKQFPINWLLLLF